MNPAHAYLSLGSNSADAAEMLQKAVKAIAELPGVEVLARSSLYYTEPRGYAHQPWFHNQVIKLGVDLRWSARGLLKELLRLEIRLGRVRDANTPRFGPRRIDIDLLLYGDETSDELRCIVPHPRMLERAFVLAPLRELEPDLAIQGKTVSQWLDALDWRIDNGRLFQNDL